MTEISVSGLVKSFEIGNNILDGITFQVETGERVGLLGRNGAGKSTLFKILTGELDYDEGDVVIAKGRRLGLISQIPRRSPAERLCAGPGLLRGDALLRPLHPQ